MSLQTKAPLPGNPNTLRDLSHATEVLMLPAAFGAIQLGETFSGCIAVNNDLKGVEVEGVSLRVEMQTATAKVLLAEHGGSDHRLASLDTLEDVVHYEIKELGQHVLACTVAYTMPDIILRERPHMEKIQTFRKFYKFQVYFIGYTFPRYHLKSKRLPIGHKSSLCQDQSTYAALALRSSFIMGERESLSGTPCAESDSGINVVVKNRVRMHGCLDFGGREWEQRRNLSILWHNGLDAASGFQLCCVHLQLDAKATQA